MTSFVFAMGGRRARAADIDLDVISHKATSFAKLSRQEVAAIFTRAIRTWRGGEMLRPFNFRPGSAERLTFDHVVLDMDPDQSAQFWIDKLVRGEGEPPRKVGDARTMLKVVASLPGGIGYVPAGVADGTVRVVARIRKGKVESP
ncbi:MAG: hypothetical protein SF187_25690 [Deltaproteobacteria bacterium]|nr:hypothetical protein [Deltaproteobacteria bacterium]